MFNLLKALGGDPDVSNLKKDFREYESELLDEEVIRKLIRINEKYLIKNYIDNGAFLETGIDIKKFSLDPTEIGFAYERICLNLKDIILKEVHISTELALMTSNFMKMKNKFSETDLELARTREELKKLKNKHKEEGNV